MKPPTQPLLPNIQRPDALITHGNKQLLETLAKIAEQGGRIIAWETIRGHNASYTLRIQWPKGTL